MCRFIFFLLAWAAAVHGTNQMQRDDPVSVPHEDCSFSREILGSNNGTHNLWTTYCSGPPIFFLPDHFNVSLVDARTEALWFRNGIIMLKDNYIPLPNLPHLQYFSYNIFGHSTSRFPLNEFLIHNKNHISILNLVGVNLSGLNKADFKGFIMLKSLDLGMCEITTIGKDIFEELGTIVDAPSLSGTFPHLETVMINNNDIKRLDWAFLSPISRSLKSLSLASNNLESVTSTADSNSPIFLESIESLDLSNNKLSTLPRFIYENLNPRSLTYFGFTSGYREQQFCENYDGCTCCELYTFTMWYRSNVPELSNSRIRLTCGGRDDTLHSGSFSPECGPADPPTRIPISGTPAPTRPQPTGQTDYQTTAEPGSQGNCQKIEPLIVSVVLLCLLQLILF